LDRDRTRIVLNHLSAFRAWGRLRGLFCDVANIFAAFGTNDSKKNVLTATIQLRDTATIGSCVFDFVYFDQHNSPLRLPFDAARAEDGICCKTDIFQSKVHCIVRCRVTLRSNFLARNSLHTPDAGRTALFSTCSASAMRRAGSDARVVNKIVGPPLISALPIPGFGS